MIRAIIFDCFGVLYVPTSTMYFERFPELHDELYDLDKMSDHGFINRKDYVTEVARLTGVSEEWTLKEFANEYTINQSMIDYIRSSVRPRYKTALLSNIGDEWMKDFFDEHQLHDLFDEVVLSSKEGLAKPNPRVFERTAEKLGVFPDECIMIDDRTENCEGARDVGMKALELGAKMTAKDVEQFIQSIEEKNA